MTATHRTHYHWPAGRYNLAGDCDSPDTLSLPAGRHYLAGDCDSLDMCTITGPLGDMTWLVTATHRTHYHWTHYHWPAGRHYLAGDCDSPDTLSLDTLSLARWEILPGWWLWLTGHTITGPLVDITWLVTATHRTHNHWPAGRHYQAGDCDSPDTLSLARWEILPDWWLRLTGHTITGPLEDITWLVTVTHRTHYHWPAGRHYLTGDCDSPDTLSLARW